MLAAQGSRREETQEDKENAMKMQRATQAIALLGILILIGSVASAGPKKPTLNWAKEVNPSNCPKGKVVVNITHDVVNSADSGVGGNLWAMLNYKKHIKIIQTAENEFCVLTTFIGDFTTVEGASPGNTDTIAAGITGTFQGGYRQTYTGTLNPDPAWPTHGYVGTFDHGWDGTGGTSPDGSVDDWEDIYLSGWTGSYEWWGFIYHGGPNGTWVNSSDGNEGDITD